MLKNTAGQFVQEQLKTIADDSAYSGSVTVYVTGDNGTQAVGSVGSGACTSKGNGVYTYAPAQAETNYGCVTFTFVGVGAEPKSITFYPSTIDKTGYSLASTGLNLVVPADPSAKPTPGTSSIVAWVAYLGAWAYNEVDATSGNVILRNSADSGNLATHSLSDDGTTLVSGTAS